MDFDARKINRNLQNIRKMFQIHDPSNDNLSAMIIYLFIFFCVFPAWNQ